MLAYATKETVDVYDSVRMAEGILEDMLKAQKGTNLLSPLQKGLQVVSEALQPDSISPKATSSGCHQGNSFDGSLSSQTSQERGPSHSRYATGRLDLKWNIARLAKVELYSSDLYSLYSLKCECVFSLSLRVCVFVYLYSSYFFIASTLPLT